MIPLRSFVMLTAFLAVPAMSARVADAAGDADFAAVASLLRTSCVKCHGPTKLSGDMRLDDLTGDVGRDRDRWAAVRDQLRDGLMPPEKEPRPDAARVQAVVAWVTARLGGDVARLPNQGNLVPHELLFGMSAAASEPPPARVWRLGPEGYQGFLRDVHRGRLDGIVQPFTLIPERGIRDFAGLYAIDEPTTEILVRNAELIVAAQSAHEIKPDGKVSGKHDTVREFTTLMDPQLEPTPAQLEAAVQTQFRMAIGRKADAEEVERLLGLYRKCVAADGDRPAAARTTLQAVLLRADAMHRSELGSANGDGRRLLAPEELARAIGLALGHRRDSTLLSAAQKGELTTREQVETQVRRLLADPKFEKPRILGFFREFFEYHRATDVFKDKPKTFLHEPRQLVADTDRLVLHVVERDRDVLRELLTTPVSFVNFALVENEKTRKFDVPKRAVVPREPRADKKKPPQPIVLGVEAVYGLPNDGWSERQPLPMPTHTRIGVLMQPSWLVAWSTNFDTDPVRRGRWVRERLLGGTVPDLPIGVVAQVPDEKHRTFRDRLQVTRDARCWKCHRQMDDLGLPFEQFDHYGRFRTTETVLDPEATAKNVDKKGQPLGPVTREADLDVTGLVAGSGDSRLDGPAADPREMLRRLADSDRVRQVFVRHAFRYYLGRNESPADARTLQEADRAYVESGGSFKTLVVALLTSEAFLLRAAPVDGAATVPSNSNATAIAGEKP